MKKTKRCGREYGGKSNIEEKKKRREKERGRERLGEKQIRRE